MLSSARMCGLYLALPGDRARLASLEYVARRCRLRARAMVTFVGRNGIAASSKAVSLRITGTYEADRSFEIASVFPGPLLEIVVFRGLLLFQNQGFHQLLYALNY